MSRTFLNGITDPRSPGVGKVYTSDASGNGAWATPAAGGGLSRWVDVTTFAGTPVLTTNTAAQNITAINAILAATAAGSTIYFPGGTYNFNAAWTMPASKQFVFQGQTMGVSGGNTLLAWTSNVAATWIVLASSTFYYHFRDLNFVSSGVTQTAGAVIDVNGNATTNFTNCTFGGLGGGFLFDCLVGTTTGFNNSWNTTVVANCIMNNYKSRGIFIDSAAASLVVSNCVIQGQWGTTTGTPASAQALAGVQANNCGALQINDCDILGNINNLLMSPAVGQVNASLFCTNTYFDNSGGSCIKITGAGATVRARFDTCSFTTAGTNYTTAGTNLSAFEIAGTFAFTATAGQGINLINCNILNTFGTTGTTNALLVTNAADFSVAYCNIANWTNGLNVTPIATLNVTKFNFTNNACGTAGGYTGLTTGVLVNSGSAFKTYTITDNDFSGCTTCVTDNGIIALGGGQKNISQNIGMWNASRAITALVTAQAVTTTDTIIAQVWLPAGGAVVGTAFRLILLGSVSAAATLTARVHWGTAGSTTDATIVSLAPVYTAVAGVKVEFDLGLAVIGASGTIRYQGQCFVTTIVPTATSQTNTTGTVVGTPINTTVGSWLSLSCSISAGTFTASYAIIEPLQ